MKNESGLIRLFYWIVGIGVLSILLLLIKIMYQGDIFCGDMSYDIISAVGDFMGGTIGVFFALATIILVWLTYQSQKDELRAQKDELKASRDLIADQLYESTYFKLVDLFIGVIELLDLRVTKRKRSSSGDQVIEEIIIIKGRDTFPY